MLFFVIEFMGFIHMFKKSLLSIMILSSSYLSAAVWHPLEVQKSVPPLESNTIEAQSSTQVITNSQQSYNNDREPELKKVNLNQIDRKTKVAVSIGQLTGVKAREAVYNGKNDSDHLSLLTWDTKHAPIAKVDVTFPIAHSVDLNVNAWTTFNGQSNKTVMNDYDWTDENNRSQLTHWSHHENTHLNYANHFDLNVNVWLLEKSNYKLGVVGGYEENRFSWTAFGGSALYPDENGNPLSYSFTSTGIGIGYKQVLKAPYIGLVGEYQRDKLEVKAGIKASNRAKNKDVDQHYKRDLTFYGEPEERSTYYAGNLNLSYFVNDKIRLFSDITYTKFKNSMTVATIVDHEDGSVMQSPGSQGIANQYYTVTTGLEYKF